MRWPRKRVGSAARYHEFVPGVGRQAYAAAGQGRFSAAQLEQKLVADGAQRVPYKNYTLCHAGDDSSPSPGHGVAVASSTQAVQTELDLLSSKAGEIPEELKARMAEVPADAQIWAVSRGGLPGSRICPSGRSRFRALEFRLVCYRHFVWRAF